MIGEGDCGEIGGMKIWQKKPKYSEKTCPSATLSTTNPTRLDPGLNPGRRGGKPATNRFSYGAALAYGRAQQSQQPHFLKPIDWIAPQVV
jgi:hypothetical protein